MKKIKLLSLLFIATTVFISCDSNSDPEPINEEEVITTLIATLTSQTDGSIVTLQSQDLDGDGPNAPVLTVVGTIMSNTIYNGTVQVLNELENPAEDITEEVEEEDDEHQFFYTPTNGIVNVTYTDMDDNGDPVGLTYTVSVSAPGTGDLTITLIHEPIKDAVGVSGGDITNAGGETDVEVTFSITAQ